MEQSRRDYILEQKNGGKKIFGVFPGFYPKELLWAFDILPVEIWDPKVEISSANSHLQPYICSVVRSGLEFILQEKTGLFDGFLFPHTCDSIQNLATLVADLIRSKVPVYFFYHPKAPYSDTSKKFYEDELKNLLNTLEKQFGKLDEKRLSEAISQMVKTHDLLNTLYKKRGERKLNLNNTAFYKEIRKAEYLAPVDLINHLTYLCENERNPKDKEISVVLSGILPNPETILQILDNKKVLIGEDDLFNCGRRYKVNYTAEKENLKTLTYNYFKMAPCSTKGSPIKERFDYLISLLKNSSSKGVIFYTVKFCEPELFDIPILSEKLKKEGYPSLAIECEVNEQFSGQMVTRIEAFLETI